MDAHTLRMLLVARSRLVSQRQATANTIRGLLKTFGLVVARGSKGLFPVRVREQIAGNSVLIAIIEPLLAVWYAIRDQVLMLVRQMLARARNDDVIVLALDRRSQKKSTVLRRPGCHQH
jgi:transposase